MSQQMELQNYPNVHAAYERYMTEFSSPPKANQLLSWCKQQAIAGIKYGNVNKYLKLKRNGNAPEKVKKPVVKHSTERIRKPEMEKLRSVSQLSERFHSAMKASQKSKSSNDFRFDKGQRRSKGFTAFAQKFEKMTEEKPAVRAIKRKPNPAVGKTGSVSQLSQRFKDAMIESQKSKSTKDFHFDKGQSRSEGFNAFTKKFEKMGETEEKAPLQKPIPRRPRKTLEKLYSHPKQEIESTSEKKQDISRNNVTHVKLNFLIPHKNDPMQIIELSCPFGTQSSVVGLKSVNELKAFVLEKIGLEVKREEVLLIYCNIALDDCMSLEYYGISDYAHLVLVMKDQAAIEAQNEEAMGQDALIHELKAVLRSKAKKQSIVVSNLSEKYGFHRQMFKLRKEKSKDPITLEEGMCYKLPCGHLITPQSLFEYCEAQFKDGESRIVCPNYSGSTKCEEVIDYVFIRQILNDTAPVTPENTLQELELMGAQALLKDKFDVQRCPQCVGIIYRNETDETSISASCPSCSISGVERAFCWRCAGDLNDGMCGNVSCSFRMLGEVIEELATCETKSIGGKNGVPAIRSCVSCSQLIHHIEGCNHMTCKCGTNFCFVCLGKYENGAWPCASSGCEIAPSQTAKDLPSGNKVSVDLFKF